MDDGWDPGSRRFADHPTGKLCAQDAAVAEYAPRGSAPSASSTARRADVPLPQGERST